MIIHMIGDPLICSGCYFSHRSFWVAGTESDKEWPSRVDQRQGCGVRRCEISLCWITNYGQSSITVSMSKTKYQLVCNAFSLFFMPCSTTGWTDYFILEQSKSAKSSYFTDLGLCVSSCVLVVFFFQEGAWRVEITSSCFMTLLTKWMLQVRYW